MIYGWSPTIGDPDTLGWLTVIGYLGASALSYRARGCVGVASRSRAVWTALTGLLAALAINKQLDLQSLGTAVVRHLAQGEGWYAERRGVQEAFILAVVMCALLTAITLGVIARDLDRWSNLALVGLLTLMTFVVVRAASFHHVDALIGATYAGLKLNHLLELGGIGVVSVAAIGKCRGFNPERRNLDL